MSSRAHSIRLLAAALAAGPMDDVEALVDRARPLVGDLGKARWLRPLAEKLAREFGAQPRPTVRQVMDRILDHRSFIEAWTRGQGRITAAHVMPVMAPAEGAPRSWDLPGISTIGELSDVLGIHADDLGWLTAYGTAEHYRHRWHQKPDGRFRLIEMPKTLLKHVQRRVLRRILDAIPPHEAAMGFRKGSSVRDFVAPHAGRHVLVRIDLEDFFPSISSARVLRVLLTAGYPEAVAHALTRLVTHAAPHGVVSEKPLAWAARRRLATPHLPQGAPTSPALANLCAFRLDCRLGGLAKAAGANYTRYADDLLFSGGEDFARQTGRFVVAAAAVILEEGFTPNHRKTRVMRRGQQQHAAGVILNERPNIDRREYDRLKAILTNCVRHGAELQNCEGHADFAAYLSGKISWVAFIHPEKGRKLRAIYEGIEWGF
ncbi:reverse transcriptase family protein [Luteolibacter flavescens]|uniref:RNA-directed DNA polymerase n=1 Tax=Luteolibacter flavescens TaxID=1859460 RepID=A0ABT3FT68_9BACT|nr:reverse transcriptase family protein [Luteolibacter flavescens]MCW1886766.1 reverse transcriptase family protein [Luteolibacter flavescens]